MLLSMQALPGRDSRANAETAPAAVTRSSAHSDQRRRILRAIGELVAEWGYAGVTIEMIVKQARVSYKTFYKHFSNKDECFQALFDSAFHSTEKAIRERLDAEGGDWAEQVVLALAILVERVVAEPLIARAVLVDTPTVGPDMFERYEQATGAFAPLLRAGRELSPLGRELPATVENTLVGSVIWSLYQRLIADEAESLPQLLPELSEFVLRTYLGQDEAARIVRAQLEHRVPAAA
jgi:AcrR family transcriptional regulator